MSVDVTEQEEHISVWFEVPAGFRSARLDDVPGTLHRVRARLDASDSPIERAAAAAVIDALRDVFDQLIDGNTVYYGMGSHTVPGHAGPVTSMLVIAFRELAVHNGRKLVFADLIAGKAAAKERGKIGYVDLENGQALIFETSRPSTLSVAGRPEPVVVPAFHIEAYVASELGDKLVTIGLSTAAVEHGPLFRPMIEALAASVSFHPPLVDDPFAVLRG